MYKRSIKLLTKTTLIYLVFILIAFFATAAFIIERTNTFIDEDTEDFFLRRERRVLHYFQEGEIDVDKIRGLKRIESINDTMSNSYPKYRDTIIHISQMDVPMLFREKTILINFSNEAFEYSMYKNIDEEDKFLQGIMRTITNTFIVLALVLTIFSLLLSGVLFRPYNRMLSLMARYKVGKSFNPELVKTSTSEFQRMQQLFGTMIDRIEDDYRKLKEYTENMAHEMQTPLAIIHSKAELLIADEGVMKNYSTIVKAIYDEATHLSNLGNTLNLLTKIENGEYSNVEKLKTFDIITNHIEAVLEMFSLKGLQLEVNLDPNHSINLDPLLFDVMLKNLLKNALRYATTDGPVKVFTTGESIVISNFGNPLPFEPSKIFNRFVGSNGTKASLGLGLALVKKICDLNQLSVHYNFNERQHIFSISECQA